MNKKVYCIRDEGEIFKSLLEENGYEIVYGDGTIEYDKIKDVAVICPITCKIDAEVLDHAPECRHICKVGVGVDSIDLEECARRGIFVTNTPESNYRAVAEHTIALMMAVGHHIAERHDLLKQEVPDWRSAEKFMNFECLDKTIAIIGFGRNGQYTAKLAAGLGMKVVVVSEHSKPEDMPEYATLAASLEEALAQADVVSLHIAATPEQRGYFDANKFAMMKKGAIFLNVTRGFTVNEDDLIAALKDGTVSGAGLDVMAEEPPVHISELYRMPNVLITPHCAAQTPESKVRRQQIEVENIISVIEHGKAPEGRLRNNPVIK